MARTTPAETLDIPVGEILRGAHRCSGDGMSIVVDGTAYRPVEFVADETGTGWAIRHTPLYGGARRPTD